MVKFPKIIIAMIMTASILSQTINGVRVSPPRVEGSEIIMDGYLDESVWAQAESVKNFQSYLPVDGRSAEDNTEIKIWYSPTAIYFGIVADEIHGKVQATMADRDNLDRDDFITIILDTYDDQRSAFSFSVNPYGQQADGILTDLSGGSGRHSSLPFRIDDNPDFIFFSKGNLNSKGFTVEVKIPLKSLRYQNKDVQDWGFNVLRKVQHSGYWSVMGNTRIGKGSFLKQGGSLVGFSGFAKVKNYSITPEIRGDLSRGLNETKYVSNNSDPLGINFRYGVSSNLTFNATVNPDFSQIEADVAQVNYDPRRAIYYPEKRPFFIDGIELFQTPTRLIYTRRIVNPAGAGKIAGKIGKTTIGLISAIDNKGSSLSAIEPVNINVLRLKRDLSGQDHIGLVITDLHQSMEGNRVFALDGKLIKNEIYSFRYQGGYSQTNQNGGRGSWVPMWDLAGNMNGRFWRTSLGFKGFHTDFNPAVGFLARDDYVTLSSSVARIFYGEKDKLVEKLNLSLRLSGNWNYLAFASNDPPEDIRLYPGFSMQLKGGWRISNFTWIEKFGYPKQFYTNYYLKSKNGFIAYSGTEALANYGMMFTLFSPQKEKFSGNITVGYGRDPNYDEWAPGNITAIESSLNFTPNDQIRLFILYNQQHNYRPSDGSLVSSNKRPRIKVEYQITPSIFLRGVIQYDSRYRDALRDNSRTELPVYVQNSDGDFSKTEQLYQNDVTADFLFSYRPNPGTLIFIGYGSALTEPDALKFRSMTRQMDRFFLKLSYLFQS